MASNVHHGYVRCGGTKVAVSRIVVICVNGELKDVQLPLTKDRLEHIERHDGLTTSYDEERAMLKWLRNVAVGEVEDRPIDEERLALLLDNRNERTRVAEDQAIAGWILMAWKAIEEALR